MLVEKQLTTRTWAEVNLDAIAHNVRQTRIKIGQSVRLMAVVKANAYGHGAIVVARVALSAGADALGVATLEEALELRQRGEIKAPILVLGYTPPYEIQTAAQYRITLTVVSFEHAVSVRRAMIECNDLPKLSVHLKIDTGMGRLGATSFPELDMMADALSESNILIEGAFTHFAQADALDKNHANHQLFLARDYFDRLAVRLNRQNLIFHAANSAAIIDLPNSYFSMVRLGISLYGVYPSDDVEKNNLPLHQAMRLFTRVARVKSVEPGVAIGYGSTFVADRRMRIATLPIGYAEGFQRILSNRGFVLVDGRRCPIVGRICMDQTMIDISAIPNVQVDDVVTVYDEETLSELARLAETIPYELLCAVSRRVPRVYPYSEMHASYGGVNL